MEVKSTPHRTGPRLKGILFRDRPRDTFYLESLLEVIVYPLLSRALKTPRSLLPDLRGLHVAHDTTQAQPSWFGRYVSTPPQRPRAFNRSHKDSRPRGPVKSRQDPLSLSSLSPRAGDPKRMQQSGSTSQHPTRGSGLTGCAEPATRRRCRRRDSFRRACRSSHHSPSSRKRRCCS